MTTFFASLDIDCSNPQRFFSKIWRHIDPSSAVLPTQRITYNNTVYEGDSLLDGWASYFESLSICSLFYTLLLTLLNFSPRKKSANIHSLPSKKAAGPDKITNEHLTFAGTLLSDIPLSPAQTEISNQLQSILHTSPDTLEFSPRKKSLLIFIHCHQRKLLDPTRLRMNI